MNATETPQITMYGQKPYADNAEFRPLLTTITTPNKALKHTTKRTFI